MRSDEGRLMNQELREAKAQALRANIARVRAVSNGNLDFMI